jgi:hypothetical protein
MGLTAGRALRKVSTKGQRECLVREKSDAMVLYTA